MSADAGREGLDAVLAELRAAQKLIIVTHENPDGDALGSLVAMQGILTRLGKDSLAFIAPSEFPLPQEYEFLSLSDVVSDPPEDVRERTIVFLDCGNLDRNPGVAFRQPGARILNIDHHHDNTMFGTVNLVDEHASCTAEIVWELMQRLGVAPTQTIAEALYVGLITDTGKFMYENTGARSHLMAAALIEAGLDVDAVYRRVYEGIPFGKLALLARGLSNAERYDGGQLAITFLSAEDFTTLEAEQSYSEGVVDHLRAVEGTVVAALVRDKLGDRGPGRKVSLRAADDRVDVSEIARAQGGGGHRRAAGFSTAMDNEEIVDFLRAAVAQQLAPVP
jgi:bifunctional oligoribonuclease and PAP phosphatase NrnA